MNLKDIPQDSLLRRWIEYLSVSEVPFSYQLAGGLSTIGAVLQRNRWIDQVDWRVFPNQSIMFIGPSGIGKDTVINRCESSIDAVKYLSKVDVLGGVTLELIHTRLASLPKPACAYIPAPEMTAFFGKADYQANLLTGVTNLLSNGSKIDISTKGSFQYGGAKYIYEPTVTMHAGSTVEWLHRGMPEGTLEGGFLGRFLIVIEEIGTKFVPLVKAGRTRAEITMINQRLIDWREGLEAIIARCQAQRRELILFTEAEELYVNWYYNRFKLFSRAVMPYANRSRDMVLRLAMLMAISRGHDRYIEGCDMQFAIDFLGEVAAKIDRVVLPPSVEAQVADKILEILPCALGQVYLKLGTRYSPVRQIDPAMELLRRTGRIKTEGGVIKENEV